MRRFQLFSCAIAALTFMLICPAAYAAADSSSDSPEKIARQCAEHVVHVAHGCAQANIAEAVHCVAVIEALQREGQEYLAHLVGRSCIAMIDARTHICVHYIHDVCVYCIHVLLHLNRPDLADALAAVCNDAIGGVVFSREIAVHAILEALGG